MPIDLGIAVTDACSGPNVLIQYELFLDLDNNGTRETLVSSRQQNMANTVYYGNASGPNYSGGEARAFDQRMVTNSGLTGIVFPHNTRLPAPGGRHQYDSTPSGILGRTHYHNCRMENTALNGLLRMSVTMKPSVNTRLRYEIARNQWLSASLCPSISCRQKWCSCMHLIFWSMQWIISRPNRT